MAHHKDSICCVVQRMWSAIRSMRGRISAMSATPPCVSIAGVSSRSGKTCPWRWRTTTCGGYVTDLITRYQVRWIEMAAVLPYWTSMIVYCVEGDRGDMGEILWTWHSLNWKISRATAGRVLGRESLLLSARVGHSQSFNAKQRQSSASNPTAPEPCGMDFLERASIHRNTTL